MQDIYNRYARAGWRGNVSGQTAGTSAGGTYSNNRGNLLPQGITYKEFDVNNSIAGMNRDSQRFVVGSDGSVYYTEDHYVTFIKIE